MPLYKDQMQREVDIAANPQRIISLVPSQSELLFHLGLEDRVLGITKFCVHPTAWYQSKARVGGTKNINFKKIEELKPDLIIANKEENEQEQIKYLMEKYPVWISDIYTLDDALAMIKSVGEICAKQNRSEEISKQIKANFAALKRKEKKLKVLYLIWKNPYIAVASHTFINNMLASCGFENELEKQERYPKLDLESIAQSKADLIFLSSEPYPFKEADKKELLEICPQAKVMLVDGEMFSWYGSRLLKAPEYFEQLIEQV